MKKIKIVVLLTITVFCANAQDEVRNLNLNVLGNVLNTQYGVYYKTAYPGNPNNGLITKPFIICEPFDPFDQYTVADQNMTGIFEYYDGDPYFFSNFLRDRGFDVIVLDLQQENTKDITRNAWVVRALIQNIIAEMDVNGSNYQITAGGVSMGGLIMKCALTYMELANEDHRVQTYISFDSPHRGANVPLGYQHFVDTWLNPILDIQQVSALLDRFNINPLNLFNDGFLNEYGSLFINTAALQMIAVSYQQNPLRQEFILKSQGLRDYPKNCRKIALASGSNGLALTDAQGNPANARDKLMQWTPGICLVDQTIALPFGLGDLDLRWCPIAMNQQVNAMPGDYLFRVYQANIGLQVEIGGSTVSPSAIQKFSFDRDYLASPLNPNMDHVPGGYYELDFLRDFDNLMENTDINIPIVWNQQYCVNIPGVGQTCANVGINYNITIELDDVFGRMESATDYKFTFVPTLRALDIDNLNGVDWFFDVSSIPDYPYPKTDQYTPFDAICPSNENLSHTDFDNIVSNFITSEVAPYDLYVQNTTFEDGYTNIYEAHNIYFGEDVDPVPNRTNVGGIEFENGSNVQFVATNGGQIAFNGTNVPFPNGAIANGVIPFNYINSYDEYGTPGGPQHLRVAEPNIDKIEPTPKTPHHNVITSYRIEGMGSNKKPNDSFKFADELNVLVYPNPVINNLQVAITSNQAQNISIRLYNIYGMLVQEFENTQIPSEGIFKFNFDLSSIDDGTYFLNVISENEVKSKKVQVKH